MARNFILKIVIKINSFLSDGKPVYSSLHTKSSA